jgi:hypothetical protein
MNKKNKILYIGPYRDNSSNGDIARNYLRSIQSKSKNKVTSIPVYLNALNGIPRTHEFASEDYKIGIEYKTIVQHLPIEHIQYLKEYEYSIAFPIVNNISSIGIDNNFEVLKLFQKILVTGKHIKKALENIGIQNIEIYNPIPEISINKDVMFNIHNFPSSKRFYFIGDLDDDIEIIKQLIISFNIATSNSTHSVLVFLLNHNNNSNISELQQIIDNLKSHTGLQYNYINKEVFVIKSFNKEELLAMHNSCDVFLSLNTHTHRLIDEADAKAYGNEVINIDDFADIEIPFYDKNHTYNYEYKKYTISTNKLIEIFKKYV